MAFPEARKGTYPDLSLIDGEKVVAQNPDQTQLTRQYTERAVEFVRGDRQKPFFLYLAHSMPHVPLFASQKFADRTERGLFGDVIEEIDWSVGEVMNALKAAGLERDTLVIFTGITMPGFLMAIRRFGREFARRQRDRLGRGSPRAVQYALGRIPANTTLCQSGSFWWAGGRGLYKEASPEPGTLARLFLESLKLRVRVLSLRWHNSKPTWGNSEFNLEEFAG